MLNKYVICMANATGKTEYWNGSSSINNAWSPSPTGGKCFDSELSAMTAFCGNAKFSGKVTKAFADACATACRLQGAIEVSILKIVSERVKKFTISAAHNFPFT